MLCVSSVQILALGFLETSVSKELLRPRGAAFDASTSRLYRLKQRGKRYKCGVAILEGMAQFI